MYLKNTGNRIRRLWFHPLLAYRLAGRFVVLGLALITATLVVLVLITPKLFDRYQPAFTLQAPLLLFSIGLLGWIAHFNRAWRMATARLQSFSKVSAGELTTPTVLLWAFRHGDFAIRLGYATAGLAGAILMLTALRLLLGELNYHALVLATTELTIAAYGPWVGGLLVKYGHIDARRRLKPSCYLLWIWSIGMLLVMAAMVLMGTTWVPPYYALPREFVVYMLPVVFVLGVMLLGSFVAQQWQADAWKRLRRKRPLLSGRQTVPPVAD